MQIEQIEIKNYRVFRDVKLTRLPPMSVIIGANGTGKSTLFDVFSFLKEALASNATSAVARRGGFKELVSRGRKGTGRDYGKVQGERWTFSDVHTGGVQ